jgi:hypothetical protein
MGDRERIDWAPFQLALALDAAEAQLAVARVADLGRAATPAGRRAAARLADLDAARLPTLGRITAMWLYDQYGRRRPRRESIEASHLRGMVWKRLQMN